MGKGRGVDTDGKEGRMGMEFYTYGKGEGRGV